MTKDLFTRQNRGIIGVGGIKCQCCNEYYGKNKKKLNKIKRTRLKQYTNKEVKNYIIFVENRKDN